MTPPLPITLAPKPGMLRIRSYRVLEMLLLVRKLLQLCYATNSYHPTVQQGQHSTACLACSQAREIP